MTKIETELNMMLLKLCELLPGNLSKSWGVAQGLYWLRSAGQDAFVRWAETNLADLFMRRGANCLTVAVAAFLMFGGWASAKGLDGQTFWKNCGGPEGSTGFDDCITILRAVEIFMFMEGSGEQLCRNDGLPVEKIARRISEVGEAGRLEAFAYLEAERLAFAVLREVHKCP